MPCAAFSPDRLRCSRTRGHDDCPPTTSVLSDSINPTIIVRIQWPRDFAQNNFWWLGVGFSPLPLKATGLVRGAPGAGSMGKRYRSAVWHRAKRIRIGFSPGPRWL